MTSPAFAIDELPPRVDDASAWYGPAMAECGEGLEILDRGEVAEIEAAGRSLAACGADLARLEKADFPLPTLAPRLARVLRELLDGRGFVLLRGLPVDRWPRASSAAAFLGLGAHLGTSRPQNAAGHVLGHVRDLGLSAQDPNVRIYQTHERQTFHTDSCDVVGLLCLQMARSGGLSALVSSTTIYNEMRERRPDLAALLFEPVATDRRGEVPPGSKPYFEIPVFNWFAGRLSTIYQRQYIASAQRFADAPRLVPAQVEALDLFDDLANDPALMMTMALEPGDLQFVHNHSLLHDRSAAAIVMPPRLPIFDGEPINLLMVRMVQPVFSAAVIAYVESHGVDLAERNSLCVPVPSPELPIDWLRMWAVNLRNMGRWRQHAGLSAWLMQCRLNGVAVFLRDVQPDNTTRIALLKQMGAQSAAAAARLPALLAATA